MNTSSLRIKMLLTTAMVNKMIGVGSQYAAAFRDSMDRPLEPCFDKTWRMGEIEPAK